MILDTLSTDFGKTHSTDATNTSFASKVPTVAEPSGSGVIDCGWRGSKCCNALLLLPIGTGQDDAVVTGMRVIGWSRLPGAPPTTKDLWIPIILGEFAAVFSSVTGATGGVLGTTYFFMDTITLVGTSGNANISHEIVSPTGNVGGHVIIDIKGSQKVEITFDLGANATGMNCLYKKL